MNDNITKLVLQLLILAVIGSVGHYVIRLERELTRAEEMIQSLDTDLHNNREEYLRRLLQLEARACPPCAEKK